MLAESPEQAPGQTLVVVENKPGASRPGAGNIAADQVAKATDDHTLGVVINGNLTSAKLLNPKLPFDPAKDFSLLSLLATAPLVLVTQPAARPAPTSSWPRATPATSGATARWASARSATWAWST
jgi:tripartite-type tricarboxylate transporter receptor subunit TctC